MNTHISPVIDGLAMAFSRLKTWFDPAEFGSPYELPTMPTDTKTKRRLPLFTKKLSMRM